MRIIGFRVLATPVFLPYCAAQVYDSPGLTG